MIRETLAAVAAEASGERALATVRTLAGFHRVQASPGYDAAAAFLEGELRGLGLDVERETVRGDGVTRRLGCLMPSGWACASATATLVSNTGRVRLCDYAAAPLSLVLRSAPARGRYPLVHVEDGTADADYDGIEVRGCVVLTGGDVHRVHQLAVLERGAAGLLSDGRRLVPPVRDAFTDPDALAYTSFWWGPETMRGWGFVVSPRNGAALRKRLDVGEALELDVEIDARDFVTDIPLLSARLPGPGDAEVLIVSHLCHPQPSANDNASGAAANLEVARVLAEMARRGALEPRTRGIRFLWVPEFTGTYAWLDRGAPAPQITAALNLDMVGEDQEQCGSVFLLEHPPCFAASFAEILLGRVRDQALEIAEPLAGPGHHRLTRVAEVPFSGGSDHAVLVDPAIGVPCPLLIQWPDRYYHSSHDTPDKCDPRSLALAVRCAATYAAILATLDDTGTARLAELVERDIRRRLLGAAGEQDAGREIGRALVAGRSAIGSLRRLGLAEPARASATAAFDAFAIRECRAPATAPAPVGLSRRPRRAVGAPLHYQRHLLPGFADQPRAWRDLWRQDEAGVGDALRLAELAWYACDGARTIDDIAAVVWLETGRFEPAFLDRHFARVATLGLCDFAPGEG